MMWWMPRRAQSCCHVADVNCMPLSEVRVAGTPNLATQDDMKAAAQCTRACGHLLQGNSLQPPSCPVDHGEDVAEAVGGNRQGAHEVHVHVAEATLRNGDWLNLSCWLLGHLSMLTLLT